MIEASNLTMAFKTFQGPRRVLSNLGFSVAPGEKLAILGRNGAGKSTLIKIIGGVLKPTTGKISRHMTLSWPIGFSGGFQHNLTGRDNVRFIARIYNKPFDEIFAITEDFAELGDYMKMEVGSYSSGMRARLAFGLSLAIEFDCYLIDEAMSVGDPKFQRKCAYELLERRKDRALIMASHDTRTILQYCTHALVLKQGRGKVFQDLRMAIDIYNSM